MWQQARLRREVKWWTDAANGPESRLTEARRTMAPPMPEPPEAASRPAHAAAPFQALHGATETFPAPMAASLRMPAAAMAPAVPETPVAPARPTELVGMGDAQVPARELSVEELIDLEQQADFFVVLGQDEAAIDLLMEHVRSSGGASPMPYLKLLEIYRRRGDRPPTSASASASTSASTAMRRTGSRPRPAARWRTTPR